MGEAGGDFLAEMVFALQLFALTYLTRWFSFATQSWMLAIEKPLYASLISVSTALVFPVLLIVCLWPLGLTGLWDELRRYRPAGGPVVHLGASAAAEIPGVAERIMLWRGGRNPLFGFSPSPTSPARHFPVEQG